ncbi:MAG: hypothetical protein RJA25_1254 [Bacteroidota bacterium]|jgi:regulator of cell morphogenesis and NO signaling
MSITKETIIGDLVAQDYRVAAIFKKNNIDFCCNGNRSIGEACEKQNISTEQVINELSGISHQNNAANIDYNSWPLDLLADYIEKKHHRYVEAKIQEIIPYLEKINRVHGGRHPELAEVEQLFKDSAGELTVHMKKEELMLFPAIRKLAQAQLTNTEPSKAPFGSVQNPISAMMHEHDIEGDRFRQISALTNDYSAPEDACNTYRVTFALLKEFEEDLHLHIHLENNILFPKSIALEEQFATV